MATNPNKKRPNSPAAYTGIAVKMALPIVAGALGGQWLDEQTNLSFPIFTLSLVLLGCGLAIYVVIRDLG